VKVPTIRYYEQIGLLRAPTRSEGNRRLFDTSDLRRLKFIRHARDLGFEVDAIRTLLALQDCPDASCETADTIARAHMTGIDRRIANLTALRTELERMVTNCTHRRVEECRVIEVLADHGQCLHAHH
jgi:DNA-binding transcriptional MerR regulator